MTEPCEKRDKRIWERIAEIKKYLDEIAFSEGIDVDTYKLAEELANPNTNMYQEHGTIVDKILSGEDLEEDEVGRLKELLKINTENKEVSEEDLFLPVLKGTKKEEDKITREPEFMPELGEFKDEEVKEILQVAKNKVAVFKKKPGQMTIDHFSGLRVDNTKQLLTDLVKKLVKEGKFYTSEAKEIVKKHAPDWLVNMDSKRIEGYVNWGKIRWELKNAGYPHSEASKLATEINRIRKREGWAAANDRLEELKKKARKRKKPI